MLARLVLAFAFIVSLSFAGRAADSHEQLVEQWYSALATADHPMFDKLLADDARVILEDIDSIQTKDEFLGSLDEWKNAVHGARLRHRIASAGDGTVTVFVCYQFPSNSTYMREIFSFRGEKIIESAQSSVGEACEGFE
ncbi:SnoaL-like domain-containing protein [Phyllobacterium sp. YR620]|uniref:nuclear transport factor 2 family protein n=1 Tax=Phyllobacterium sp. YR620 TaxID=1881066 RepID=UPI0008831DAE|nr:DUF4440 domain-containing protein [Phyllobacterium sp. YR620]SDP40013.1 SnoaL-like domain-containing protein [Phyllobacterium sp. YR620]